MGQADHSILVKGTIGPLYYSQGDNRTTLL